MPSEIFSPRAGGTRHTDTGVHEGKVLSDDLRMQPRAGSTRMGLAGAGIHLRQSEVLSTDWLDHVDHYTVVTHVNAAGLLRSPAASLCSHPQREQPGCVGRDATMARSK